MWLQVIFDIPVKTKSDKRSASQFRQLLLKLGFDMVQFSVYMKYIFSKEKSNSIISKIEQSLPEKGSIYIISITDKQYEQIYSFIGKKKKKNLKNPGQLELF